ncbi:MAG: hypothetical protein HXY43_17750 [Fischerella sp.]|jgi:hypothetical protein|uniref:hypothetical protein n=1 Tax=Fischerella sp. TaxID=1191 RepID=UPI0017EC29C1|nr:hypothetical protein [Fischerella sp.]NWF61049.1 hypothetical protein [Fischerella sp.]
MAETYRDLLILICLGLLGWGVIRIERIYQYPFFMGSMFISFIVPQAFALINNPASVSQEALERVLFVSCLSAAACWIGYEMKPNQKWLANLNIIIDERKLFRAGIVLIAQAWFFNFLLAHTTIQKSAVNGNWTGPATIYFFFIQAGNIAFGIFILQLLKRPNIINFIFAVLSGMPLFSQVMSGRRQPTMTFAIIIGISFWLVRRYIPSKALVITAIVVMTFLIPVFGELRSDFWNLVFSGDWQGVLSASQIAFSNLQKGEILELRNAALLIDATDFTGVYGYGSSWWDSIIFQFVPGQIVGFDFKQSLQLNLVGVNYELLKSKYAYTPPTGATFTGLADSFTEFSYFGCLSFALIGYIFKNLWISAVYYKSIFSQLLYMGLVSPAMLALTHGIGRWWQEALFQLVFLGLASYYSRDRNKSYYRNLGNYGG